VVVVQGGLIGRWSRRFGDRRLILMGLLVLGSGLLMIATTWRIPVPWYSQETVAIELSASRTLPGETPPIQDLQIDLPDDSTTGWFGLVWLMVAMIPAAVGGGVLQPSINSMLTRRSKATEVGGILGISAAFLSGANALAPLVLAALFQWIGPSAPFFAGAAVLFVLWPFAKRGISADYHT
jgi:MFS family permease